MPTKTNFLGGFKNAEIISGIVAAAGIIFGIGNYFGKLEKDRDIIGYQEKLKILTQRDEEIKKGNQKLKSDVSNLTLKTISNDTLKTR